MLLAASDSSSSLSLPQIVQLRILPIFVFLRNWEPKLVIYFWHFSLLQVNEKGLVLGREDFLVS